MPIAADRLCGAQPPSAQEGTSIVQGRTVNETKLFHISPILGSIFLNKKELRFSEFMKTEPLDPFFQVILI